jgi:hypothetical protein
VEAVSSSLLVLDDLKRCHENFHRLQLKIKTLFKSREMVHAINQKPFPDGFARKEDKFRRED